MVAVLKRQTKLLNTNCEFVSFYYICNLHTLNLLKTILSQAFPERFAKIAYDISISKNLIIYFAEAFRYFSHYQFITLLPFSYHISGAASFLRTPPSDSFS